MYVDDMIERHADNLLEKPEMMFWSNQNLGNVSDLPKLYGSRRKYSPRGQISS